jgi:hypothetical protein
VVHADDATATAAGRATDLMILKKIVGVLGPDVTMGRLHAALTTLLGDAPVVGSPVVDSTVADGASRINAADVDGPLTESERTNLRALFGDGFRHQVAGNLVRLAAVVEPLSALGTAPQERPPARLTCLSLADGPRDVATDLTAALVVQWVTRAVSADAATADGARPAVILAGADEQSTRHLARLTAVCERYDIPLVRTFSRLTEESARHLDTRHTAFMRLATRAEALRAAEHIGMERRFVAGRFAHRHSISRSRTRTTSDSVTHTSGRTQGEATTHTTGTTTGQAYSEAEVPRHQQEVHVHVEDHRPRDDRDQGRRPAGREEPDGLRAGAREPAQEERGSGASSGGGSARDKRSDRSVRDTAEKGTGARDGAGVRDAAQKTGDPRPRDRGGSGWGNSWGGGGGKRPAGSSGSSAGRGNPPKSGKSGKQGKQAKPQIDIVKTRTWFTAKHESEAKTKSWSTTEETSHTSTKSQSRTDGVSVGDEITYELVYDHKVQPETLLSLPEDQMLAPHVVEATATPDAVTGGTGTEGVGIGSTGRPAAENKMVALIIDPAVIGAERVAPVNPSEIPAFEPPVPQVSGHVPDYQRVRKELSPGTGDPS